MHDNFPVSNACTGEAATNDMWGRTSYGEATKIKQICLCFQNCETFSQWKHFHCENFDSDVVSIGHVQLKDTTYMSKWLTVIGVRLVLPWVLMHHMVQVFVIKNYKLWFPKCISFMRKYYWHEQEKCGNIPQNLFQKWNPDCSWISRLSSKKT